MLKNVIRTIVFLFIIGHSILFAIYFGWFSVNRIENDHPLLIVGLVILIPLMAISTVSIWGLMLHHCGTNGFLGRKAKSLWLIMMILGSVPVALAYYVVVYELGKGLQTEES